ncbi:LysR family transcriptional regulator [Kordiimonas sediminis]|nr:LysR family transcriptional regulator [Kordiimonas sediminis]
MNFRQIEVFYSVMTEGSITGAAKKLGISQPSVTTTVKQAEEKIGFRLFEREGGRLIPTAEARVLFEEATRAQEALTAIDRLADRLRDGISGHVSIAATASFCLEIIPDVIATFTKQYPHYSLSISTHNTDAILRKLDARTGTHNIGFTFGTGNYDGLSTSKLGTADLFAVLPPSWPMIKGDTINIADLNHKPYIGAVQSTPLGTTIENTLLQEGVEPNRVATVHSHQLALDLVKRDLGFSLLETVTVHNLIKSNTEPNVRIKKLSHPVKLPVTAVFPGGRTLSNPSKHFLDCVRSRFRRLCTDVNNAL